jgi:hypothetical protein
MADKLYNHMRFNPKLPVKQYDYKLLIVGNENQLHAIYDLLRILIREKDIKSIFDGTRSEIHKFSIEVYNGVTIIGRL